MKHSFLCGAEAEYLEAVQFFEDQRSGLGVSLISEFERIVAAPVTGSSALGSNGCWTSPIQPLIKFTPYAISKQFRAPNP